MAGAATWSARHDGAVDVLNRCREGALDAPERRALGRARVVDRATNAKLEVGLFRPFWGDSWVIDLDPGYAWAVVGHTGRDYLWIAAGRPRGPRRRARPSSSGCARAATRPPGGCARRSPPGARPFEVPGAAPPG